MARELQPLTIQPIKYSDFIDPSDNDRPPDAAIRATTAIIGAGLASNSQLMAAAAGGGLNIVVSGSNPAAIRAPQKIADLNGNQLAALGSLGGLAARGVAADAPKNSDQKEPASPPPSDDPKAADADKAVTADNPQPADDSAIDDKKTSKPDKEAAPKISQKTPKKKQEDPVASPPPDPKPSVDTDGSGVDSDADGDLTNDGPTASTDGADLVSYPDDDGTSNDGQSAADLTSTPDQPVVANDDGGSVNASDPDAGVSTPAVVGDAGPPAPDAG